MSLSGEDLCFSDSSVEVFRWVSYCVSDAEVFWMYLGTGTSRIESSKSTSAMSRYEPGEVGPVRSTSLSGDDTGVLIRSHLFLCTT